MILLKADDFDGFDGEALAELDVLVSREPLPEIVVGEARFRSVRREGGGERRPRMASFTRNNSGDSGEGASILGGSHLGVARYSQHQDEAIELVRFLNNEESQRARAIESSRPPTLTALYEDEEIAEKQPFIPLWKPVIDNAIVRPAAPTKTDYNEVSSEVWTAAHDVMSGKMEAKSAIGRLNAKLQRLKGNGW